MSASLPWESRDGSISIIACSWSAPWVLGPAVSGDVPVASGMYDSDEVAGETTWYGEFMVWDWQDYAQSGGG